MRVERFEDLIAWQKARALTREVYLLATQGRFAQDFVLSKQIRGAALSVSSNIAEGFERGSRNEFTQFLSIAKASCAEVRNDLYEAVDIGYIDEQTATRVIANPRGRANRRRAKKCRRKTAETDSVLSPQPSVLK